MEIDPKQLNAMRKFHSIIRSRMPDNPHATQLEQVFQSDLTQTLAVPDFILFPFKKVEKDDENFEEKKISQ